MEKQTKNYTIGLDIGTNSVGWAVMYDNYDLVKRKMKIYGNTDIKYIKKNFWGTRLFDSSKTAEDRRKARTTKRRLDRRRKRLCYLQTIFHDEMNQVDDSFFYRLSESFLDMEDKINEKHPIFGTMEEELAFHAQYPTIYHLRKKLAESDEKADLRLIYLAMAHMIKFRGHFLIEGHLNTDNLSANDAFIAFLNSYNEVCLADDNQLLSVEKNNKEIEKALIGSVSRSEKAEAILALFPKEKKNGLFSQFVKLIVGNQGNFKTVFNLENEVKFKFTSEEYEESLNELLLEIGEEYEAVFAKAYQVYSAITLSNILKINDKKSLTPFSSGMIESYTKHGKDLKSFKRFIKEHLPEKYHEVFYDTSKDGYAGYICGKKSKTDSPAKSVSLEEFYKYIKHLIENIPEAACFLKEIEREDFLLKQRMSDNSVIPHQIHLEELQMILAKQKKYYPFLDENQEKIQQLLTFRIPYYVGPLANGNSNFEWLVRKKAGNIRPWNLDEIVDINQSAIKFIENMTNTDAYLPMNNEKVLPKHSIIYEKYMVFNELTKVSYTDEQQKQHNFSSEQKIKIFDKFFKKNKRVKSQDIKKFLESEYLTEVNKINGLEDGKFNASFGTYQDFIKAGVDKELLDNPEKEKMWEEIVKILTIFTDRKMIRKQLSQFADCLEKDVLKNLERRRYKGWGRLSAKLLTGIYDQETQKNILDFLINDDATPRNMNRNFMQLINDDDLSFKQIIKESQEEQVYLNYQDSTQTAMFFRKTVAELPGSPGIKKGILQALYVVQELVEIMGYVPTNIVIEMARENQTTTKGKNKAKPRKSKLEKGLNELGSDLAKKNAVKNEALQNNRLYLYYLQNGKEMYTGEPLSLNKLSEYEIDHIIPQSFIKDNSLNNLVLVSKTSNQNKGNNVPSFDTVQKMKYYWKKLLDAKLISKQKYDNLTKMERGGLTDADKAVFIQRQLVETRQITKHVAQILHQFFNQSIETKKTASDKYPVKIITLKAALTSQFRQIFELYKVRSINDHHHAHDAYLNAVVATSLLKIYPKLTPELVYGDYVQFNAFKTNKATAKKQFFSNIMHCYKKELPLTNDENGEILWGQQDIQQVKRVMSYHQVNVVKKVEVQTGIFYDQTVWPKGNSEKLIPKKIIYQRINMVV